MSTIPSFFALVPLLASLLAIWVYFVIRFRGADQRVPWAFLILILSIFVIRDVIPLWVFDAKFYLRISWLIIGLFLWIKREELYSYHIIGQIRIFNNIAVGALLGLMMALVTIIKLDVNEIIDITSLDQSLGLVLWVSLAFKVIETAMIEELLFRGILLGYLDTYMPMRWMANIVQSAVFCLAHLPRHWDSVRW